MSLYDEVDLVRLVAPRGAWVPDDSPLDLITDLRPAWQDHANCAGVDPDLFFPERGASTREAKAVCAACPVRDECLEFALVHVEKFGIWGGTSERQRRRIRDERRRAAEGSAA